MALAMRISLGDWNRKNRTFWAEAASKLPTLITKRHISSLLRRISRAKSVKGLSAPELFAQLREQVSLEARIFRRDVQFRESQRSNAAEPRRKCVGTEVGRVDLIRNFASAPEYRDLPTKRLWDPLFTYLEMAGLKPSKAEHPTDLARYSYEYNGKNGRVQISHRRFETLVSQVAPRRG